MPVNPILLPQDALVRACEVRSRRVRLRRRRRRGLDDRAHAGLPIPSGSVIVGGYVDVLTQLTSGGAATIACQIEAANDILTAVAVASWTVGRKNILRTALDRRLTAGTAVKTTAARDISIVIGAAALTAGKFDVVLYVIPPLA
jgi:hypothetical protein